MGQGAIWLHRQLLDCPDLADPFALAVWVHLLLRAQHKPYRGDFRGASYQLERGQLVTSMRALEKETRVPMQRLRTILQRFAKCGMLRIDTAPNTAASVVTICKYDDFQTLERSTNTAPNTASTQSQHTEQEWKNLPTPNVESESQTESHTAQAKPARRVRKEWPKAFERLWNTYPVRDDDTKPACLKRFNAIAATVDLEALLASAARWREAQLDNPYRIGLLRWLREAQFHHPPPAYRPNGHSQATFATILNTQTTEFTDGADEFGPVLEGTRADEPYEASSDGSLPCPFGAGHAPDAGGLHGRAAAPSGTGSRRWVPSVGTAEGHMAVAVGTSRVH